MAMINCPECGQEISEKAKKCVHCGTILIEEKPQMKSCSECGKESPIEVEECEFCGCPFEDSVEGTSTSKNDKIDINKKKLIPIAVSVAVILIGIILYYTLVIKPQNTYEEAMALLEKGKYNEAEELLKDIDSYEDVAQIRKQIKYELLAYSAVNAVKDILKNPDSITIYDINFYSGIEGASDKSEEESTNTEEPETIIDEEHPCIIIHLGAQNGMGGLTESWAYCQYYIKDEIYKLELYTDELDVEELDEDDEDYLMELFSASIIEMYYEEGIEVGEIDMSRFKAILKNDAYSAIKIID